MKDTYKKKRQKKKKLSSFFFEKKFAQSFFFTKTKISTQNEKTAKKGGTWKTYGNNEKIGK